MPKPLYYHAFQAMLILYRYASRLRAYDKMNPELRQTFNTISRNFESANEAAQVNIYDFTSHYIDPCLRGIKSYISDCIATCFPVAEDQLRRKRGRSQGRADFDFDFYDDWEEDEGNTSHVSGWGNDELDSLLAGRGQPRVHRAMSYGARGRRTDLDSDPNVIPKSSYLGFLDRLPFKIGARVLRYKPSSAGLQENPGGLRIRDHEVEPLVEEDAIHEQNGTARTKGHARTRSQTAASQSSTTTRSARSDLIMSDEDDDAVPIDDEFASAMLSRRTTSSATDELARTKLGSGKRPVISRTSTRTTSSKSLHRDKTRRSSSKKALQPFSMEAISMDKHNESPSLSDLKREEAQLEQEEELEIAMKRNAASKLAQATGLSDGNGNDHKSPAMSESNPTTPIRTPSRQFAILHSPASPLEMDVGETEPFPEISMTPKRSEDDTKPP